MAEARRRRRRAARRRDAAGRGGPARLPVRARALYAFAAGDGILRGLVEALDGFRPPLSPEPFETLVTLDQRPAGLAARGDRDPQPARRPLRRAARRARRRVPARETIAGLEEDDLFALGYSHRKAQYIVALARSELDLGALDPCPTRRSSPPARAPGDRRLDGRLVPRPASRAAARLAGRRPRRAQGSLPLLSWPRTSELSIEETRAMGDRFDPFQNLTAHYLLTGARTAAA